MFYENSRFVATRDPSRGGLQIVAATIGFEDEVKNEIYNECLEMITRDQEHDCCGVYPLSNGQYAIMAARKVNGSKKESRKHEVVRGMVLSPKELQQFCESYIAEGRFEEFFFPNEVDPDVPQDWSIMEYDINHSKNLMQKFLGQLEYPQLLGLFQAIGQVGKTNDKIQLIVQEGGEWILLAACCCMAVQSGTKLFIMVNGECTLTPPDIVITDRLLYLDSYNYQKMSIEQFIDYGSEMGFGRSTEDEDMSELRQLVEKCCEYVHSDTMADEELYEAMEHLKVSDRSQYAKFKRCMKLKMIRMKMDGYFPERYMKLLFALFKCPVSMTENETLELCNAPYDYSGMYRILKKKVRSKRELRRLMAFMLEVQFKEQGMAWSKAAYDTGGGISDMIY